MTLSSSLKQPKLPSETHKSKYADYLAPGMSQENTSYLMTSALATLSGKMDAIRSSTGDAPAAAACSAA